MYILKLDLPSGVAYFTGKKRIVQDTESPGLTGDPAEARLYEDKEEATRYCKMLIRKYDMEFYISDIDESEIGSIEGDRATGRAASSDDVSISDFREYNFNGRRT